MKNFLNNRQDIKYKLEKFEETLIPESINRLVYGFKAEKYVKQGSKKHNRIFYLLDDDYRYLQWISPHKTFTKSRIFLNDIKDISREIHWKIKNKNDQRFLRVQTANYELVLFFQSEMDRDYFQCGLQYFCIQASHHEYLEKKSDQVKHLANILFLNADKDGNKQLNLDEVRRLLQELHVSVNKKYLKQLFLTYDINRNGQIDQIEFIHIIRDINSKEELLEVFQKYCPQYNQKLSQDQEGIMTVAQYQQFMLVEQQQNISTTDATDIFRNINNILIFNKGDTNKHSTNLKISFYQFSNLIFSQENSIFDSKKEENYQSMDYPLTDYYINSSHNTYLMANQLTGESSCQAYINAILKGCRCVELDCWDGEKNEPLVYHGHTLTSRILLKDVLETIDKYAFMMSPYPMILSFENHCSLEQTKIIALYLRTIFQDKLHFVPKDYESQQYYKSPNQLRGKIIIKSKGKVEKAVSDNPDLGYLSDSDEEEEEASKTDLQIVEQNNNFIPDILEQQIHQTGKKKTLFLQKNKEEQKQLMDIALQKQQNSPKQISPQTNNQNPHAPTKTTFFQNMNDILKMSNDQEKIIAQPQQQSDQIAAKQKQNSISQQQHPLTEQKSDKQINGEGEKKKKQNEKDQKQIKKVKECKELLEVTTMFGCHIDIKKTDQKCWYISSISEVKYEKLIRKYPQQLVEIFKKSFVRLYPAGIRVDSSNYDPIKGFLCGSQIIALNFQTNDFPMLMNHSKFLENGGINSGYVLKPDFLLHNSKKLYCPTKMQKIVKVVRIQIISGQQLRPEDYEQDTFDVVDPYMQLFVKGTDFDEKNNKPQITDVISDNGFHPIWNSQVFEFKFACPELAMIVFRSMDSDVGVDTQLGIYSAPVDCLRPGYRIIPQRSKSNLEFIDHCFILVKISIQENIQRYTIGNSQQHAKNLKINQHK